MLPVHLITVKIPRNWNPRSSLLPAQLFNSPRPTAVINGQRGSDMSSSVFAMNNDPNVQDNLQLWVPGGYIAAVSRARRSRAVGGTHTNQAHQHSWPSVTNGPLWLTTIHWQWDPLTFTARRNVSAVYAVVMCQSVRPSQGGTVPKRLNVESGKQRWK